MSVLTENELFWAIGLLEGEGCFSFTKSGPYFYPRVQAGSTDLDVLQRLQRIAGGNINGPYSGRKENHAPMWHYDLHGVEADLLISAIYENLGKRRQSQIDKQRAKPTRLQRS